jgi:hypothetical protein
MSENAASGGGPQQPAGGSTTPPPPTHPLISKLVAHKDHPDSGAVLIGYVGPAGKEGFIRLYPEVDLSVFLEIPLGALIHSEPVDSSQPLSKTKLVVNASEKIAHVQVAQASFFEGPIASKSAGSLQNVCHELSAVKTPGCPPPTEVP